MSTPQSGPPPIPGGNAADRGEFRSQQGLVLGWESAVEQVMDQLRLYYVPEYRSEEQRLPTEWRRGGEGGVPVLENTPPAAAPNYYIGEQYIELNYAPQCLVFCRAPVPVREQPTPGIGYRRNGYKQISAAIYTIQTRIWAFNDTDGQELFNYLIAAAYVQTIGSAIGSVWESLAYMPKRVSTNGIVMEFGLKVGVPIFLPPKAPQRPAQINQRTSLCLPPTSDT